MTDAPKRIWINKVYGQHPEDWDFTDGECYTKAQLRQKVEYVRADHIEELVKERDYTEGTNDTLIALNQALEAKLAKAMEFIQEVRRNGDTRLASMAIAVLAELEGK